MNIRYDKCNDMYWWDLTYNYLKDGVHFVNSVIDYNESSYLIYRIKLSKKQYGKSLSWYKEGIYQWINNMFGDSSHKYNDFNFMFSTMRIISYSPQWLEKFLKIITILKFVWWSMKKFHK